MKQLLTIMCLTLMFTGTPAIAKPAAKCEAKQTCKVSKAHKKHKVLKGHKVPVRKK